MILNLVLVVILITISHCSSSIQSFKTVDEIDYSQLRSKEIIIKKIVSDKMDAENLDKLNLDLKDYIKNRQSKSLSYKFDSRDELESYKSYYLTIQLLNFKKQIFREPNERGVWDEERRYLDHIRIEIDKTMKVRFQLINLISNTTLIDAIAEKTITDVAIHQVTGYKKDNWYYYQDLEDYPLPDETNNSELLKVILNEFLSKLEEKVN